ncbi:hypothetical protein [Shewanella frigidimarina]|uniref:DUF4393 domain-containing protein n=1 Tax=Shewanella frigidimarina TaxID=56812 RepID=A0A106C1Q0_SHEFR|nr:hypothetical protein [Shewanella frigidimarina]KVX02628.1 hypothetical protein AWJ07_13040 [Shewanella frigidimarina]
MKEETFLEKVCSNTGTSVATTLIAASGGVYLAPLIPMLTASFANNRYQKRVENAFFDVNERLSPLEVAVKNLSDNQFKLVGEILSFIMHTTNDDKIELLKNAAISGVKSDGLQEHEASVLSRILRDISIVEFNYLDSIKHYDLIFSMGNMSAEKILEMKAKNKNGNKVVSVEEPEEQLLLNTLAGFDLLKVSGSGYGADYIYRLTPMSYKLFELCS